jgi:hypothetical protein
MSIVAHQTEDVLDLSPGDLVRVRSAAEIFRTLDAEGSFDDLPFMPEMVPYCGRTLRVDKRADKTCDGAILRRMSNTVHLVDIRCDGSAHDGCQAGCLTYWKEAWLERADADDSSAENSSEKSQLGPSEQAFVDETLLRATIRSASADSEDRIYRCQATEIPRIAAQIKAWMIDQYPKDVRNWGLLKVVRGMTVYVFNKYQDSTRGRLPARLLVNKGRNYPVLEGRLEKSRSGPAELDLQPGDLVRIKSKEEVLATLDGKNRNKGLSFDVEMLPYCGTVARVKTRVNHIIDERNGKMINMKWDCYILDGVVCKADYHRFCTRKIYSYWRSVWLEKLS